MNKIEGTLKFYVFKIKYIPFVNTNVAQKQFVLLLINTLTDSYQGKQNMAKEGRNIMIPMMSNFQQNIYYFS